MWWLSYSESNSDIFLQEGCLSHFPSLGKKGRGRYNRVPMSQNCTSRSLIWITNLLGRHFDALVKRQVNVHHWNLSLFVLQFLRIFVDTFFANFYSTAIVSSKKWAYYVKRLFKPFLFFLLNVHRKKDATSKII